MSEDFQRIIQTDRDTRSKNIWKGNMLQYLEKVREEPTIPKLAHKRMFDVMMGAGVTEYSVDENPRLKRLSHDAKHKV